MPKMAGRSGARSCRTEAVEAHGPSRRHDAAVEQYGEGERAHRTAMASLKRTHEKRAAGCRTGRPSDPRSKKTTRRSGAAKARPSAASTSSRTRSRSSTSAPPRRRGPLECQARPRARSRASSRPRVASAAWTTRRRSPGRRARSGSRPRRSRATASGSTRRAAWPSTTTPTCGSGRSTSSRTSGRSIWEFFEVDASEPYERVLTTREMPGARVVPRRPAQLRGARLPRPRRRRGGDPTCLRAAAAG